MVNEDFYRDYFENIARSLKDIGHSDDEKRFYYIDDPTDPAPIVEALKNDISYPALLLEQFTDHVSSMQSDNHQQFLNCGFAVILPTEKGNRSSIQLAKTQARSIALKILAKMRQDAFDGVLQNNFVFQEVDFTGEDIGPIGGRYYGWRYDFKWRLPVEMCLNPDDWQEPG